MPRMCINPNLMPLDEAKKIILTSFAAPDNRITVPVPDACGRVLAGPVCSKRTNPPLILGGPDGIAVRSNETTGAGKDNGIELEAPRVNTGMPLPEGFDAVIAIEEVTKVAENRYMIHAPVSPYENTIPKGSDVEEGDLIMDGGHLITPLDIGALLNCGLTEIPVKNWKVGLIATGDEIISPDETPVPGQIVNTNSYIFGAYLKQYGVEPVLYPILSDNRDLIAQGIHKALVECDMVMVFGGSSAGSKDFTVNALKDSGELLIHGVAMGPGKPASMARVNGKPAFGMPGPSISARTVFHELVRPLLVQWGVPVIPDTIVRGVLAADIPSMGKFDRFMMVKVEKKDGETSIVPLSRSPGYMIMVRADAILHVPGTFALHSGDVVKVRMLRTIPSP
ncbi:molybdenum cofactor synthesis domain-containing protein [Methanolacinia paynteri]|uniref:molybdenum cofactor synthesis domain-containing protein n=1 Tax=Methanolacinia paynteri TaxID=230356 RepID=UPI00064FDA6F|nr:molybdenum cofactor synthesis domain-containing protein [Methanolacinia paynteri]